MRAELITPLPLRVRLRLAVEGAINHVGYWLICHDHTDAAVRLWKLCRMWD